MKNINIVDVLVIGGGTAGTNAAKQAIKSGANNVVVVHTKNLTNTCIESGCMPSKSILAAGHAHMPIKQALSERDLHIDRLMKALTKEFESEKFKIILGNAHFEKDGTVSVINDGNTTSYNPNKIIIATGSIPFIPPIPGLNTLCDKMLVSDDIVSKRGKLKNIPRRTLVLGGGPIGLELATFLHNMGSHVEILEKGNLLGLYDTEFGVERVRASMSSSNFSIRTETSLVSVKNIDTGVLCSIANNEKTSQEEFDSILIATGRRPNTDSLRLENTKITFDERKRIKHDEYLETNHNGIFIAGDVTGHHQILHYAAEMGKVAGHNATMPKKRRQIDYDKFMLAVSFDQFPSAIIGITEKEAKLRGIDIIIATRCFNSIGLGILKRQEFGIWKLVAERKTGKIIGSQIIGPESAGELIQILVPIIHNKNTYDDILNMPWYHPTFGEILKSLARDMSK